MTASGGDAPSTPSMLRFDVYGREVGIVREDGRWSAVFVGPEGKHRPAPEIVVPPDLPASELIRFLGDLFHESARPDRPDIVRLDAETEPTRDGVS